MSKITKATFKSFVNKNKGKLYVNVGRSYDGMVDGCVDVNSGYKPAVNTEKFSEHTCGINGVWLVGGGRDSFYKVDTAEFTGIEVYNSCGSFSVAIKR